MSRSNSPVRIATWHERESRTVHPEMEYAGHHEEHQTHPGDYPVLFRGYWCSASIASTRTYYHFVNRLGAYTSIKKDHTPTPDSVSVHIDRFGLAKAVQEGRATLEPGWRLEETGAFYDPDTRLRPIIRVVRDSDTLQEAP